MRAIVLEGPRQARLHDDLPSPQPRRGEVIVAIERAGMCGSDLALYRGARTAAYPLIMGHEAVGRIVDPNGSPHVIGSRVVIEPNIPCGTCAICRRGHGNVCPAKRSLGMNCPGVFAEMVVVPADFVHPLPADIALEDAVGIEPLAVALHAFSAGAVGPGDPVAVVGCGAEGLLLVQVAAAFGARVLALDVRADSLRAADQMGAAQTMCIPTDGSGEGAIAQAARAWSPTVVFEAAGAASALEMAVSLAAPGGRVVALGLATASITIEPLAFVRRGLTLIGSLIYDHPADFQRTIEVVRSRAIRPSVHVAQVIDDLAAVPAAFEAMALGDQAGKRHVTIAQQVPA